jgi:hypothetical protein
MPVIDDAAILRRGRGLCENDRMAWDYRTLVARRGVGVKGAVDDEARRDYLMRARLQLLRENGNAPS